MPSPPQQRKRKGGAQKERERKMKELDQQGKTCRKLTDMFAASTSQTQFHHIQLNSESQNEQNCSYANNIQVSPNHADDMGDKDEADQMENYIACMENVNEEANDVDGGDEEENDVDGGDEEENDADGGDEEANDVDGGDEETNKLDMDPFSPPELGAPLAIKLAFLSLHPVQSEHMKTNHKFPFDKTRVFYGELPDGTTIPRNWISYDGEKNKLYCSTCMAFCSHEARKSNWITGVSGIPKDLYKSIVKHETSIAHRHCVDSLLRVSNEKSINFLFDSKIRQDIQKRRMIVERIISIVIFLATQGLPYRGHRNEAVHSLREVSAINSDPLKRMGNFMALVKLLTKFDPILQEHVKVSAIKSSTTQGRGSFVSFLSKSFVNKILLTIRDMIKETIAEQIKSAKLYSMEVDSTQDITTTDQLSICLRYVTAGSVYDRLFAVVDIQDGSGKGIFETVKSELEGNGIQLESMIGICTDGGANFSGMYNGLRAHLRSVNPDMVYVYDINHNLNIAIQHASSSSIASQDLFSLLNKTAVFISRTHTRADVWRGVVKGE